MIQSSRSVLQLYYSDRGFTDSLCTICQDAISSIQNVEDDPNYNHLFNYLQEYWSTDHNISSLLTVPATIGTDNPLNDIGLFLNYIPFVTINDTSKPKTSGNKVSFIDRLVADWTSTRVRIAFRTAIDIIYATFSTLVIHNSPEISEKNADMFMVQINNYLNLEKDIPEYGKFRIISARYFSKVVAIISESCPSYAFHLFKSTIANQIKSIKKNTEVDLRYMLNIDICLFSNLRAKTKFELDTKKLNEIITNLLSVVSKKSKNEDSTLQKDTCSCLVNFFGVVLFVNKELQDSQFLTDISKLVKHQCENYSVFLCLRALLLCFDKGKLGKPKEKEKFFLKIIKMTTHQGDALNAFTIFLRGNRYEPRSYIDENKSNFNWTPDKCISNDMKQIMVEFILTNPKVFKPYQDELSDFFIQYASIDITSFVKFVLPRVSEIIYFQENAKAVLRVGKILLVHNTNMEISQEYRAKINELFNNAVYLILQNVLSDNKMETNNLKVFHVSPFYPIYLAHESDYGSSIKYIDQGANPMSFRNIIDINTPRFIKSKWCASVSKDDSYQKIPLFETSECQISIYNGGLSTDQTLLGIMTIIPHFQIDELLISRVISLLYSPLTDISAFAIRLIELFFIAYEKHQIIIKMLIEQVKTIEKITNEYLYMLLYILHELIDSSINMMLPLENDENYKLEDDLNYAIILGLCSQNASVHDMTFSLANVVNQIFSKKSIYSLIQKYNKKISHDAKFSAIFSVSEINSAELPDIQFSDIGHTNYSRLYMYYIAAFADCFVTDIKDTSKKKALLQKSLYMKIFDTLETLTKDRCDSFFFNAVLIFLVNSYHNSFEEKNKEKILEKLISYLDDKRIEEWTGMPLFSSINAKERHKWLSISPTSTTKAQAISLGIRVTINDDTTEDTAKKYMKYMTSIVHFLKKNKLIRSKLSFSFSMQVFPQYSDIVRIILDSAAAIFKLIYNKHKRVPPGPYLRREVITINVSDHFDVEFWYIFILNFISNKIKSYKSSSSFKVSTGSSNHQNSHHNIPISNPTTSLANNTARGSALNSLSSILLIALPPESIYNKFINNISKYDESSLSILLSFYTEQLLPTFIIKALSSEHSDKYFTAIVNQFQSSSTDFMDKWMSNMVGTMSPSDIRFADTIFSLTGTLIALSFSKIIKKSNVTRHQAFSLLLNTSVGALGYLNKPESAALIYNKMQSLKFTISSQLKNLYMSALLSISNLLSHELNIVSEPFIATIIDGLAMGGNAKLLSSILAPWIKAPKFDDDSPIVFTATQPQFACFTRFSFAKSFSRIKLTQSLTYVIDALLTTNNAQSFLTIALFSLYQSDPASYSSLSTTLSYIIKQRPLECAPLITELLEFQTWFYYNNEMKLSSQSHSKLEKLKGYRQSMVVNYSEPTMPPRHKSPSDSNLSREILHFSNYELAVHFGIKTITATNFDIYKSYKHRLYAYALVTMEPNSDNSLIHFLIPNAFTPEDVENKISMEVRSQGPAFARNLGREFLNWGLCCGNLKYAIQALSLYRKILLPSEECIITKLIHCIKLASIASNENKENPEYNHTLILYAANCFETLRILAEKNETRSLELFDLCIELLNVRDSDMQSVAFSLLSFLVKDANFAALVKDHEISITSYITIPFDESSCESFVKLLIEIAKVDLFNYVGSPIFTIVVILLLYPFVSTRNADLSFCAQFASKFDDFSIHNKLTELSHLTDLEDPLYAESTFYLGKGLEESELATLSKIVASALVNSQSSVVGMIYRFVIEIMSSNDCDVNVFSPIISIKERNPDFSSLVNSMIEIFEKNKGVVTPQTSEIPNAQLPNYENFDIPSFSKSLSDSSPIFDLPPIYFNNLSNCPTNNNVLKAISRIKSQPLNDWSDLMFRAESSSSQIEMLKSKNSTQHLFEGLSFKEALSNYISIQNSKDTNENLNSSIVNFKDNPDYVSNNNIFCLSSNEMDSIWKSSLNPKKSDYKLFNSMKL